jgi:transposase
LRFITNLNDGISAEEILETYRLRWKVEIYFKRLKSILDFGELPKRRLDSVIAWLNGGTVVQDKQEKVLKKFSRARHNEEAVNIEKVHFCKTDKRVNPKQEDPFWLSVGELPILLSAPHDVRHIRQRKIKMSDQFTGSIVYLLHKLTGCHAISVTKLSLWRGS